MVTLSKSKLLAFRQCPKRLWLEVHRPELRQDSRAVQASFDIGHQVGALARRLYDPAGKGVLVDAQAEGYDAAFARSMALLDSTGPVFEAGFRTDCALAFADVMLPQRKAGKRVWRMVEVKSSTDVKDYQRDDAAVQFFVARAAGVPLAGIALAHIDKTWVYPGAGDYQGLLVEHDVTDQVRQRSDEVRRWIDAARAVARRRTAPAGGTGRHCSEPYDCGFHAHCRSAEPQAEYPAGWLPDMRKREPKAIIEARPDCDMRDVPDDLLNETQQRVKAATLTACPYFDAEGAARALREHKLPAYFMDFETVNPAVPVWAGTRPYQQIPFQFSVHRMSRSGRIEHEAFIDLSGNDPSKAFARALIAACGERGPVFVYNAAFERARLRELAERFPRRAAALRALDDRVVDLLPVARQHYYHPSQQGSWSIKKVLPALCPDLDYAGLDGVQDGGMAMEAYREAVAPHTSASRKAEIERQLLAYCALDTQAMVRLWSVFSGVRPERA